MDANEIRPQNIEPEKILDFYNNDIALENFSDLPEGQETLDIANVDHDLGAQIKSAIASGLLKTDYSQIPDDYEHESYFDFVEQEALDDIDSFLEKLQDYAESAIAGPGIIVDDIGDWLQGALNPVLTTLGIEPPSINGGGGDPLVIDLDADGHIELTSLENGVYFDLWGDGNAKKISWVAPDDGFLAIDENGNGQIDDVHELFGIGEPLSIVADSIFSSLENGFTELASHDSNGDGMINALDDVWSSLVVWQDANQNGTTEDGELITMDQAANDNLEFSERSSVCQVA